MKTFWAVVAVAAAGAAGCGDNSRQCGTGTFDERGVCVADPGGGINCSDGTQLDPDTNTCVIDPNACQDGTVLVGTECVDPAHVTTDLEEGIEPNGLDLLGERSADPAGGIVLKPVGESFVAHGKIIPFQDSDADGQTDPDIDTYTIEVTEPTLLTVTVDGVHGLAGAFFSVALVDANHPLDTWRRVGLNLTGDTSKRQLFLPAAGTYGVAITDSRTIFLGSAAQPPAGGLDLEYYATFTAQQATPTMLTVTSGVAADTGELAPGEVKLFTVPMNLGSAFAVLDTPDDEIAGSLVVSNARSGGATIVKGVGDEDDDIGQPALVSTIGFRTGDTTTVVVDHLLNTANQNVAYDLAVFTEAATALKRDGTSATAPTDVFGNNVFFYDVTAANEIDGFNIAFDTDIAVQIFDENGALFSNMTVDPNVGPDTMIDYAGHFRHPTAGRYYWIAFDPTETITELIATSTITAVTPTAVTKGTPTGNVNVSTVFESNVFSYDAAVATDAWQQFNASSAGGAGTIELRFLHPATAFGRLDDLTTAGGCGGDCDDFFPLFNNAFASNGSTTVGRILLDDNTETYLVLANTTTPAGTVALSFARRPHTDLGSKNAGDTDAKDDQALDNGVTIQRYLVRTARDNEVEVVVNPDGALFDIRLEHVNANESVRQTVNTVGNVPETGTFYQRGDGWTAWVVTPVILGTNTFDQDVEILPARYTVAATATAFDDACIGGTAVPLSDDDDGVSAAISAPANFDLFGTSASAFRVTTNGILNFNTAQTGSFAFPTVMPSTGNPNGIIAPFWTDLAGVSVCTKTSGTKRIVQWNGFAFGEPADGSSSVVEFQAILDGIDDTIEFVYGPNHGPSGAATGERGGAEIGVENQTGTKSKALGSDEAIVTPGFSTKLTPTP